MKKVIINDRLYVVEDDYTVRVAEKAYMADLYGAAAVPFVLNNVSGRLIPTGTITIKYFVDESGNWTRLRKY